MEKILDYKNLYRLQDVILTKLFKLDNLFYLTGGTALHRFTYNLRYSDDLDFFANNDPNFHEHIEQLLYSLQEDGIFFKLQVRSKDFSRIIVKNELQVDFVNDYVYREGISRIMATMRVDNVFNILTNKIGAIIDRDEEKDFFDLFAITYHEDFIWKDMLEIARKKSPLDKDRFLYRIETFPLPWLEKIKTIKPLIITNKDIAALVDDIRMERSNSLKKY